MTDAQRVWSLNGDFASLKPTGVPRYAREVTRALDALVGERHPLTQGLKLELVAPCEPRSLLLDNIPVRVVPEYRKPRLPQVWVQLQLPRHVSGGLVSFCNLAPVAIKKHIVCIHDLHTRLVPESYGLGFRMAHRVILPLLGRRARHIATVSSLSRDHLVAYDVAPAEKITITYNGGDHAMRWNAAASNRAIGVRPFVFCLGQDQTYKNTGLIWRIAPALDALGLDVYVAGALSPAAQARLGARPANLHTLGRISDDDLALMFRAALCFLFPSRIEGFGLPAIEAMTRGCPVIASDSPCLPEVCADGALYAGPDDVDGWVAAVEALHTDQRLRTEMTTRGHAVASRYTWRRVALSYLSLMARADGMEPVREAVMPHQRPAAGTATAARALRGGGTR